MMTVRLLPMLPIVFFVFAACSSETPIGEVEGRAGPPLTDECGNGFDDNGDGRIDEDPCVCGTGETQPCWTGDRGAEALGACTAGTQRCSATASQEFGSWGSCDDVVEPGTEVCEGAVDEDCDGAVDEGCGGCDPGATRACAGAAVGPCLPGAQTCSDAGEWSDCEGAVRPGAEVCDDGIDNDCDGLVDDPAFCDCVPMPEVCDDGVDNDCDGMRDEDACRVCVPTAEVCNGMDDDCDGTVDEGACSDGGVDAGMCTEPAAETCDGVDEDCDGVIDNGACTACACERWTGEYAPLELVGRLPRRGTYRHRVVEVAFDGEESIAFLHTSQIPAVSAELFLEFRRPDGSAIGTTRSLGAIPDIPGGLFAPTQNAISGPIAFGGGRFVATWATGLVEPGAGAIHAAAFGPDAAMIVSPVVLDVGGPAAARMVGLAMVGDNAYLVFERSLTLYVQRFDAALSPVGSPVEIPGINNHTLGIDVRTIGNTVAITGTARPGTVVRIALVRDGALVGATDLATVSSRSVEVRTSVATDGTDDALVCYTDIGSSISCRHISLADASPTGPGFRVLLDDASRAMDVLFAGCAYQLVLGIATGSGSQSKYRAFEIDASDTVRTYVMDRLWVQSNQSFSAFPTNAGGLLRVLEDRQIALQSCAPALPEPDCDELQADMITAACEGCGDDSSYCHVASPGGGGGGSRDRYEPKSCEFLDTVACRIAMDQPQECSAEGAWLVPVDCQLPE